MALQSGTRLGAYEIVSLLGAGGMGEVYRARDTKLNRDVALKILPAAVATDADRLARFKREAQVLASLNHPHIAAIYGFEDSGETHALVLELVEGPTLAGRIAKGPIPIDEALPIARQIAEALEAAHEQGIVHRDLKPANIKLRPDGMVKVLDFGLAKAMEPASALSAPGGHARTMSPTITTPAMTQAGMILGTAAYMSPEQARGKTADKRADIWAFGVVLYEMLTGRRAFGGDEVSDVLAAVLAREPSWEAVPDEVPAHIRDILAACLQKDLRQRVHDIADARLAMDGAFARGETRGSSAYAESAMAQLWKRTVPWVVGITVGVVATVLIWGPSRPGEFGQRPLRRFAIHPTGRLSPDAGNLLGISPDATTLVYEAFDGDDRRLYRRPMDQVGDTPFAGTQWGIVGGQSGGPFFSPDGAWVAFDHQGALKRIPLAGGSPQTIADSVYYSGGSWGTDDTIVLGGRRSGLLRVPAKGGSPTAIVSPNAGEGEFLFPQILPGSRFVLFTVSPTPGSGHLEIAALEGGQRRVVLKDGIAGRVLPSGHLVFFRKRRLWAVRFDLDRLETAGDPVPVVEDIRSETEGPVQYAVANDGTLAYIQAPGAGPPRSLVWVGQDGRERPTMAPRAHYTWARLSPDGRRVAVEVDEGGNSEVGIVDLERGTLSYLTHDPASDKSPVWTPDGERIVFSSDREGTLGLFTTTPDGTGPVERLAAFERMLVVEPGGWSADASRLAFVYIPGRVAIGTLRLDGSGKWEPLLDSGRAVFQTPSVSRDGRWIAYTSTETQQNEVYVQRFPELGKKIKVSQGGGIDPVWSLDGSRLYYRSGTMVMVVSIKDGRPSGSAEPLFEWIYYRANPGPRTYDIGQGTALLAIKPDAAGRDPEVHVVLNWFEELKRLVPNK
jgi:serine/threonine-protein kinase